MTMTIPIYEYILELESRIEKNDTLDVDDICTVADFYEKNKNETKLSKYYLIAIEMKCLKAYYLYGNWLNNHKRPELMTEYFVKAIDLYFLNDYYKSKEEEDISETKDEYGKKQTYTEYIVTKMMELLGIYYDNIMQETEDTKRNALKYYNMAVERGSVNSMYNIGNLYFEINDLENMFKYYGMAVDLGDIDTMYELAIYYQKQKDFDNMRKYYLMALEEYKNPEHKKVLINNGVKDFDIFNLKEELDKIEEKPIFLQTKLQKINCIPDIMIYTNKKKLFTELNYIRECGICYETKLNINLYCGHCFCISCYPKLYKNPCPVCRI